MNVGVLGGGQLGRMLGIAGAQLGVRLRFFDPSQEACAFAVGERVCAPYADSDALRRFATGLDVVTFEFENVPVAAVDTVRDVCEVRPSVESLRAAQDRLLERDALQQAGCTTPNARPVDTFESLETASAQVGVPGLLKTRRGGYDGKGQSLVGTRQHLAAAWRAIDAPSIYDETIAFQRELSQVSVRAADGEVRHYPLVENEHRDGILRRTIAPAADVPDVFAAHARESTARLMENLSHIGVMAVEFFETADGLIANEFAPRVHNSGHWTIDFAQTSQFENHLRAVLGLPLGSTEVTSVCEMINLIGDAPGLPDLLTDEGAHVHMYDKAPRPGRKIGHVTRATA